MTDKEQREIFAKNLNHYVKQSGKEQREIAIDIGFEPTTFNTWCVGKILPSASKIRMIADYFNIGVSFLLDENPDPSLAVLYSGLSADALAVAKAFDAADLFDQINVLRTLGLQKRACDMLQGLNDTKEKLA